MEQVLEELDSLCLDRLDEDWVQAIYHSEFLEIADFPPEYESAIENVNIKHVFQNIIKTVETWLDPDYETEEEQSWTSLSPKVPHQRLLTVLAFYIDYGTKNVHTKEYRNNALLASRVYYTLLSIPGFKAYHIYHAQLFCHSLACLGFPKEMCDKDDNYYNTKELTREVNSVIRELRPYVVDLRSVVEKLQLKPTDMNFEDIISHLVDITGGAIVNKLNVDKIELANISQVIYMMIDTLLVEPSGEPNAVAIRLLFKCLLPKLVSASLDCRNANNLVRASYVTYAAILLSKYAKAAVSGFHVLLQHLCYAVEGLERAEVRQARVSLVVGLMSLLPRRSYSSTVKWLLKLTTTAKISHRHIGMEILAELLSNDPEDPPPPPPAQQKPQPTLEDTPQSEPEQSTSKTVQKPNEVQSATESETSKTTETPAMEMETSTNNETGTNTESDQPLGDQSLADQPLGDQSLADQSLGDQSLGDQSLANQSLADQPLGDQSLDDQPLGDQSLDDIPLGDLLPTDQTLENLLLADQPPPDQTFDDLMTADQPTGETEADQTAMDQTTDDLNTVDRATEEQPAKDQTSVDQTTVDQTAANQVTAEPSTMDQSVADQSKVDNKSAADQPTAVSTEDESSQEAVTEIEHEPTEEEVAGLLLTRRHTVPHGLVLRALLARAGDVSSTLRTRALGILAACAERPGGTPAARAFQELNGSAACGRLVGCAARCAGDERAAVRRAALQLLQRMMRRHEDCVTDNNLGVLVSLCRDASILVRSAAITALGELTIQWGRASVTDAFLTGPLHQLSDPETKVQEQVVALIQQILIERLQKYSRAAGDPLPWTFLAAVTRHSMQRHLQKACALLAKTAKCINHKIVDILSTHLGAVSDERDLQCLVMLTSVSRHVDYTELGFLLDYYYNITRDTDQDRDARLLPLTLELLADWSSYLSDDARSHLRAHLIRALGEASAAADNCRTSCAALAAHLDPANLQWANELLHIYQRRALSGGPVAEWVCAADMSLVAPQPPDDALLQLFLNAAVDTPPIDVSPATRGCTVAGLGRLCARSRSAAAAAAPPLARLLDAPAEPVQARVNALLTLTDICTRYTCIVEPLLGCVASCLAVSACAALRRAAATALTRLMLGGFLRLRTPLYYTYCALLADEDHDVREPAEYYVTCCLGADVIYHHFVECVLHYNKEHSGSISFDARQLIYDVMLQRMSLVQKLNIQCRLATEVLEHAADMCDEGDGELSPSLNAALLDTITLLCGPRMKLPRKPQKDGEADIDDLQERVTTNIVSHKMKRTVAEVLVPAVLRLYARLRTRGGQLNVYLVRIATDLLKDYRQEIEELIENDPELVSGIRMFQENIGTVPTFGNTRNLVTASTGAEPETPRAPRRRPRAPGSTPRRGPPATRKLRV